MIRVLFVDDEPRVLDGIRRMLLAQRSVWDMQFATGGEQALALAREGEFDLIVTDMRMPEMDGATLLEHFRSRYPGTIRVVLSGHSELESALRAMAVAHQYLSKPCEGAVLVDTLQQALSLRQWLTNDQLRDLVHRIGSLPTVPSTYTQLTRALADTSCAIEGVAQLIAKDQGLAGKVLQMANSAFFGRSRSAKSLQAAVALLGTVSVKHLVLTAELFTSLPGMTAESIEELQRHASLVARIASTLEPGAAWKDDAFSAGLLHDAGVLLIAVRLPQEAAQVTLFIETGHMRRVDAERAVLGVHHGQLAGYLFSLWGLPGPMVAAIAGHPEVDLAQVVQLDVTAAVAVADHLAHEAEGTLPAHAIIPQGAQWDAWRAHANELFSEEAAA